MVVTEAQAREMQAAIRDFQDKDGQIRKAQRQDDLALALTWYNQQGINIPSATTRTQALDNFTQIESLLETETDRNRIEVLGIKLKEANEKYKQVKRVNPNS